MTSTRTGEDEPSPPDNGPSGAFWDRAVDDAHRRDLVSDAFAMSASGLAICDSDGRVVVVNRSLADFLGRDPATEVVGERLQVFMVREDRRAATAANDRAFVRPDGSVCWGRVQRAPLTADAGDHTLVQVDDVTELREQREQLEYDAGHDDLTGLVNRRAFMRALERALASPRSSAALLVVDVDRFKTINDALGHPEGDRLLETVAGRLRSTMRADDVVCRLGGDEFAILLRSPVTVAEAAATAARVVDRAGEPIRLDDQPVVTSVSVGVSFSTEQSTIESLLREADAALYKAKSEGRNRFAVFDDELRRALEQRSRLEGELRLALSAERLELHFQPEVDLESGSLVGVEALVRWPHPVHGTLGADAFVGLAEDAGIVGELGAWVLLDACRTLASWHDRPGLVMRVNVSTAQLSQPDLLEEVAEALAATGIAPGRLCLEITETAVMTDVERSMVVLAQLNELGVRLAIDDFGTGFSSLAYLKRFPVEALKIDRSFIEDVPHDADSMSIVASVLGLAHSLDLEVIAEGVESVTQRDALVSLGCRRAQGHYFSPALDREGFERWMAAVP